MLTTATKNIRVERRCPRCRVHRYHWVDLASKRITCAECGNRWKDRVRQDDL